MEAISFVRPVTIRVCVQSVEALNVCVYTHGCSICLCVHPWRLYTFTCPVNVGSVCPVIGGSIRLCIQSMEALYHVCICFEGALSLLV